MVASVLFIIAQLVRLKSYYFLSTVFCVLFSALRIDAEVSSLKEKLDIMKESHHSLIERSAKSHEEMTFSTVEVRLIFSHKLAQTHTCQNTNDWILITLNKFGVNFPLLGNSFICIYLEVHCSTAG